jgi:predicted nucleic acid-binding protein
LIIYVDSSLLVSAYLADEAGHEAARGLLSDPESPVISGTWTPIEVSGALVRAARAGRGREDRLLSLLDEDITHDGPVTILAVPQDHVEVRAMEIVRSSGLRSMDAWHLAAAESLLTELADPNEPAAFATRDKAQADVATALGFEVI